MSIAILIQVTLGGLLLGGLYALVAFGLSLVYGVAGILNFSHGTLLAVAGIIASVLYAATGLNPLIIGVILIPGFLVFGYFFYAYFLDPLTSRNPFENTVGTVLVTVGALLILSDLSALLAGPTVKNIPLRFQTIEIGDVIISMTQVFIFAGIAALITGLHLFIKRSWIGRAMRAVAQDQVAAQICGVRPNKIRCYTFAVGSGIVAVAAILYVLSFPVDPYMGFSLTVKAFTIIILGGIGNLLGALLAGLFLGVVEAMTAFFWASDWAPAVSIILLLVILVIFPRGIVARLRS